MEVAAKGAVLGTGASQPRPLHARQFRGYVLCCRKPRAALVALLPNTSSSKWKKRWGDRRQDGRRTPLLLRAVILATAGMAADGVNILESGEGECANLLEDRCSIT
jgi:hypothetical protein